MCGGKGSRLKPLTENTPKPLVRILNKPVLELILEKVISSGISDIYLSLGYMGNDIAEHCYRIFSDIKINYVFEDEPLGTAGGVRNCLKDNCDDDILVLSGDNIFDFDLNALFDYHSETDSDFTVCATTVSDPREYGVINCDEDGSIKYFIEKPTWEQASGNLINTGIYIMKGSILSKIPDGKRYDFSDDLFPEIFRSNLRFMCYKAHGFWGDMGEFNSYREITEKLLDDNCENFQYSGIFYGKDENTENGAEIIAPCIIGKNCTIQKNTVIGPYTVIGDNCIIEGNSVIKNSTVGYNCRIGCDCDLNSCFVDDNVIINDNCLLEKDTVIGYSSVIGRFTRVLAGNKVWVGRRIEAETIVSKDMLFENPEKISFDIFGITAKANSQLSLSDIVQLGQAIASADGIDRVGVGSDSDYVSENFRNALISGLRACGAVVYDFGEMFKMQSRFYSAYCNLDMFVFIGTSGDVVSVSFCGKNGLPVDVRQARIINNNYKFATYLFSEPSQYKEVFNMKLFSIVYKSFYKKLCQLPLTGISVSFESDNEIIKELAGDLFEQNSESSSAEARKYQFLLNNSASELFVVENGKVYSSDRLLALLCEFECAQGNDIIIPEEAPDCIEDKVKEYDGKVYRIFENSSNNISFSERRILNSVWTADMFMLTAKLLDILNNTDISLEALFECHKNFAVRKSILDVGIKAQNVRKVLMDCGAVKAQDNIYYVFDGRIGKVRIRQLGNSSKIRMLAEADDMEAAKEISVLMTQKIKNHNVDKNE